jgi:ABC-type Mn2+/Zn2+ transport system ATPase subunit
MMAPTEQSAPVLLKLSQVEYSINERPLFDDLSISLSAGNLLFIKGPNGAGKSSLVRLILGFIQPQHGHLRLNVARHEIAFLPQSQNMHFALPMTIGDVLQLDKPKSFNPRAITELGLLSAEHLQRSWNHASGGEKQRTLLTRVLLQKPRLLILDEPFNHLDVASRQQAVEAVETYLHRHRHRAAAIMVGHDAFTKWWRNPANIQSIQLGDERLVEE